MSSDIWQVVLIDALFLCMAAGMGLWFRAWLARQQQHLDRRLDALEAQHARLERVSGRLQTVSRVLELMGREGGEGLKEKRAPYRLRSRKLILSRPGKCSVREQNLWRLPSGSASAWPRSN